MRPFFYGSCVSTVSSSTLDRSAFSTVVVTDSSDAARRFLCDCFSACKSLQSLRSSAIFPENYLA